MICLYFFWVSNMDADDGNILDLKQQTSGMPAARLVRLRMGRDGTSGGVKSLLTLLLLGYQNTSLQLGRIYCEPEITDGSNYSTELDEQGDLCFIGSWKGRFGSYAV